MNKIKKFFSELYDKYCGFCVRLSMKIYDKEKINKNRDQILYKMTDAYKNDDDYCFVSLDYLGITKDEAIEIYLPKIDKMGFSAELTENYNKKLGIYIQL